jgi:hypothetical protein
MLRATLFSEGVVEKNPVVFPGFFGTRGKHSPPKTFYKIFFIESENSLQPFLEKLKSKNNSIWKYYCGKKGCRTIFKFA